MDRRAVRLLLAIVLAAVLLHPDAVVEGKEAPERHRCGTCEVTRLDVANSPVSKVPAISESLGITENVCKQVADHVQLVFQGEEGSCNEKCRASIKKGLLEAMEDYNGLVDFINHNRPSIQQLKEYICEEDAISS